MREKLAAAAIWTSARLRLAMLALLAVIAIRAVAALAGAPDVAAAPVQPASSSIQGRADRGGRDINPEPDSLAAPAS